MAVTKHWVTLSVLREDPLRLRQIASCRVATLVNAEQTSLRFKHQWLSLFFTLP